MTYRNNHKPQNIIPVDVSTVHPKHLEGFIQGVKAALEAKEKQS